MKRTSSHQQKLPEREAEKKSPSNSPIKTMTFAPQEPIERKDSLEGLDLSNMQP